MKSLGLCLLNVALLAMLVACGKDNESGKSSYSNPYYSNQYGTINSPYNYGNYSVNQIFAEHPCTTAGVPTQNRVQAQMPINIGTVLQANDLFVGVTSVGDVAVLVGQGSSQALLVTYICQRGVTYQNATPQVQALNYGAKTFCNFKPLNALTILIPGGVTPLYFRWLDGGSSQGAKFSMCKYLIPPGAPIPSY